MVIAIVGWYGEQRQSRLFDVPDVIVEDLRIFIGSGMTTDEMADDLDALRGGYEAIAAVPMGGLDRYYRERLAAMYVWEKLPDLQIVPAMTLEFSLA